MNGLATNVVITGATGFLGSALAARILSQKGSVIALTRNDSSGQRTLNAIKNAAQGFNLKLTPKDEQRLFVVECNLDKLNDLAICSQKFESYSVWHCAAEMSYDVTQLEHSLDINLISTQQLYQYFSQEQGCTRFNYVSTAYTAGFNVDIATESLHLQPQLINAYQTSKWAAEMSLSAASHSTNLPITLFRPSIICGHEKTGWHGNSQFGLYGFLAALKAARRLKSKTIEVDVKQKSLPNFIPVNKVIEHIMLLEESKSQRARFEIVHSVAYESLKATKIAQIINQLWGANFKIGQPKSRISERINDLLEPNLPFLNHVWHFSQRSIPQLVQGKFEPYVMTTSTMINLISSFYLPPEKQRLSNLL